MSKNDQHYYVDICHILSSIEEQLKEFNFVSLHDIHDVLQKTLFSPPTLTQGSIHYAKMCLLKLHI
jgi:hypothetical protein